MNVLIDYALLKSLLIISSEVFFIDLPDSFQIKFAKNGVIYNCQLPGKPVTFAVDFNKAVQVIAFYGL